MSDLVVNCPKCTKGLKLRDRSKIGKKARCPKCSHVFVLSVPSEPDESADEVELKLASEVASAFSSGRSAGCGCCSTLGAG